jgi:hypothetical protein
MLKVQSLLFLRTAPLWKCCGLASCFLLVSLGTTLWVIQHSERIYAKFDTALGTTAAFSCMVLLLFTLLRFLLATNKCVWNLMLPGSYSSPNQGPTSTLCAKTNLKNSVSQAVRNFNCQIVYANCNYEV